MAKRKRSAGRGFAFIVCIGLLFFGSCVPLSYEPMVVMPAMMPGAQYVGAETCEGCHEKEHKYFGLSDHASVTVKISDEDAEAGVAESCETCHGPGSLHVEDYGNVDKIILSDSELCFSCHLDIKGKFMLQHHHPVTEGIMDCSDCHNMHGKDVRATGKELLLGPDEKCFNCHKDQKGPWIFVHDAMREGCSMCHQVHGSINDKLLVAGQTTTCIRCHFQLGFNTPSGNIGTFPHGAFIGVGRGEECVDCHLAPHGSNISRSLLR